MYIYNSNLKSNRGPMYVLLLSSWFPYTDVLLCPLYHIIFPEFLLRSQSSQWLLFWSHLLKPFPITGRNDPMLNFILLIYMWSFLLPQNGISWLWWLTHRIANLEHYNTLWAGVKGSFLHRPKNWLVRQQIDSWDNKVRTQSRIY
jgi:hypothetical protein